MTTKPTSYLKQAIKNSIREDKQAEPKEPLRFLDYGTLKVIEYE